MNRRGFLRALGAVAIAAAAAPFLPAPARRWALEARGYIYGVTLDLRNPDELAALRSVELKVGDDTVSYEDTPWARALEHVTVSNVTDLERISGYDLYLAELFLE